MTDWADEVDEVDVSLTEEKLPEPTEIDKGKFIFKLKNSQYLSFRWPTHQNLVQVACKWTEWKKGNDKSHPNFWFGKNSYVEKSCNTKELG